MTAVETETRNAGRRLTVEEERRGAELFAAGLSTRAVAKELNVGNGTAARLKQRLAERAETPEPQPAAEEAAGNNYSFQQPDKEPMAALKAKAERLTAQHVTLTERAQAAREAVEDIDAQRIEALAGGGDSARFASRRLELETEHTRLTADAGVVAGLLRDVEQEIACRVAAGQLAQARAMLTVAVRERDAVYARSGDRQRAAVEAAWAAAVDFAQIPVDEQEADSAVAQAFTRAAALAQQLGEPAPDVPAAVSTWLPASPSAPGGPELALYRAGLRARHGDVGAVAVQLGETGGWLPDPPPDAEEMARRAEVAAQRERQVAEEFARAKAGPGWQPAPADANLDDFTGHLEVRRDRSDAYPGTPPESAFGFPIRGW